MEGYVLMLNAPVHVGPFVDSPKTYVGDTKKFGRGLFTVADIDPGEFITAFDGVDYQADRNSALPSKDIADHAIQIARRRWIDSCGGARYINHSCEPNAGIQGTRVLVALRRILAGEQIFYDYETTERSDFEMLCQCGCAGCRQIIGSYDNLPSAKREEYGQHISEWIRYEESQHS